MLHENHTEGVFRSQRESALALAVRIETMDELVAELLADVLVGFDALLAKHAAFEAYYTSTRGAAS